MTHNSPSGSMNIKHIIYLQYQNGGRISYLSLGTFLLSDDLSPVRFEITVPAVKQIRWQQYAQYYEDGPKGDPKARIQLLHQLGGCYERSFLRWLHHVSQFLQPITVVVRPLCLQQRTSPSSSSWYALHCSKLLQDWIESIHQIYGGRFSNHDSPSII